MGKRSSLRQLLSRLTNKTADQGAERNRRALLTAIINVLSQIVQLATGLISVPLALSYLGVERFGIWMTLSAALAFITFSDLGVGIGLQDRMAKYLGLNDYGSARQSFFTALTFLSIVFVILMAIAVIAAQRANLVELFSLRSAEAIKEIVPTTISVAFCISLGLVAGIVQRAFNSFQEGFWVATIQAGARVCSLVLLFVVVRLQLGLPALVFVVGGLSHAVLLIVGLPLLLKRHSGMRLNMTKISELFSMSALRGILKIGVLGFGASVAIYFVNNTALVVMAQKYGAAEVADFAVLLKLIGIPAMLQTYLLLPLWPAITEAKVRQDNGWIKQTYHRCMRLTIILSIVTSAGLLLLGQEIIRVWTRDASVVPDLGLILAGAVFTVLGYWNTLTSVILNGLSRYKGQATYGLAIALLFAGLSIIIPSHWPKESIVWMVTAGYLIRCVLMQNEVNAYLRQSTTDKPAPL